MRRISLKAKQESQAAKGQAARQSFLLCDALYEASAIERETWRKPELAIALAAALASGADSDAIGLLMIGADSEGHTWARKPFMRAGKAHDKMMHAIKSILEA